MLPSVLHLGTVKCIIGVILFIRSTFLHTLSIPGPVRPGLFWSGARLAVSVAVLQDDGLLWLCSRSLFKKPQMSRSFSLSASIHCNYRTFLSLAVPFHIVHPLTHSVWTELILTADPTGDIMFCWTDLQAVHCLISLVYRVSEAWWHDFYVYVQGHNLI